MWKDSERAKRQKTAKWVGGQLGGKVAAEAAAGAVTAVGAAVAVGAAAVIKAAIAIKDKKGDIWDKEALNALFNEII